MEAIYPGVTPAAARAATGWPLAVIEDPELLPPPTASELQVLREMHTATESAHRAIVRIPLPASV